MKIRIQRLCFAMACLAAVPQAPAEDDGAAEKRAFKDEIIHEINAQRAAYREDLRMRDKQLNTLSGELQVWTEYVTALQKRLKAGTIVGPQKARPEPAFVVRRDVFPIVFADLWRR